MKRYRSDEDEPYYRNLVVRNIPAEIKDHDVVECLQEEYSKYGKCRVGYYEIVERSSLFQVRMGKDDHDDRVGFIEFAHHESAKDAKAARGHLVMNERRLRIDVWQGYKKDR